MTSDETGPQPETPQEDPFLSAIEGWRQEGIGTDSLRVGLALFYGRLFTMMGSVPENRILLNEGLPGPPDPYFLMDSVDLVGFPLEPLSLATANLFSYALLDRYLAATRTSLAKMGQGGAKDLYERTVGMARSVLASGGSPGEAVSVLAEGTALDNQNMTTAINQVLDATADFATSGTIARVVRRNT